MERPLLFADDVKKMSFQNIQRIRQFIHSAHQKDPAPTTNVEEKLYATTKTINAATGQAEGPPDGHMTVNANRQSTVDEEDEEDVITMQLRRLPDQRRPTTHTTRTMGHSDARSKY